MKKFYLTIITFVTSLVAISQNANLLYDHLSLQDAIVKYESILAKNQNNGEAIYNLADAYRLNNETVKAEEWYSKAVSTSENIDAKFYYAQMLLMNGKPEKAKKWFANYKLHLSGNEANHIDEFTALCDKIINNEVKERYFNISSVIFNSKELDFSPTYYGEDIVFVSNRESSTGGKNVMDNWTDQKYTDLYVASTKNGFKVTNFSKHINSNLHEASACFDKEQTTIYFTRNNYVKGKTKDDNSKNVRLQIMKSNKLGDDWGNPIKMSFNNDNYSYCHPVLTNDEEYMLFASDQPGGFGGMDLYYVKKEGENWGVPENLGEEINTSGNEVFPFIDEFNNLYFSSNFHAGFGGLDVFKADYKNNKWTNPQNIGLPLNSVKDDFGIICKDNFNEGYFSSNRSGQDEIYSFKNLGTKLITGRVVNCETGEPIVDADVTINKDKKVFKKLISDEKGYFSFEVKRGETSEFIVEAVKKMFNTSQNCTGKQQFNSSDNVELLLSLTDKIQGATYSLCGLILNEDCNYLLDEAEITLINICNGEELKLKSDINGKFNFPLVKNCKYKLIAEKKYFTTIVKTFTTDSLTEDCYPLELKMNSTVDLRDPSYSFNGSDKILLKEGTVIDLYNVYFDFDKYDIRQDATEELEWVRKILTDYPDMKVEISAHTDSRASITYNNTLSHNRANSVVKYLLDKGISTDRMIAIGYGESKLKNECSDNVNCTTIQHQRNRRVEFKVISFKGEAMVSKEWKAYK